MSLYNLIHGVTLTTFLILPVLGKHPDEYPRFRDASIGDKENPKTKDKLLVYTRTGGPNREAYLAENTMITEMTGYLFDYDDDFDNTYAKWIFDIPAKWQDDVDKLLANDPCNTSIDYQVMVINTFPKLRNQLTQYFMTGEKP